MPFGQQDPAAKKKPPTDIWGDPGAGPAVPKPIWEAPQQGGGQPGGFKPFKPQAPGLPKAQPKGPSPSQFSSLIPGLKPGAGMIKPVPGVVPQQAGGALPPPPPADNQPAFLGAPEPKPEAPGASDLFVEELMQQVGGGGEGSNPMLDLLLGQAAKTGPDPWTDADIKAEQDALAAQNAMDQLALQEQMAGAGLLGAGAYAGAMGDLTTAGQQAVAGLKIDMLAENKKNELEAEKAQLQAYLQAYSTTMDDATKLAYQEKLLELDQQKFELEKSESEAKNTQALKDEVTGAMANLNSLWNAAGNEDAPDMLQWEIGQAGGEIQQAMALGDIDFATAQALLTQYTNYLAALGEAEYELPGDPNYAFVIKTANDWLAAALAEAAGGGGWTAPEQGPGPIPDENG